MRSGLLPNATFDDCSGTGGDTVAANQMNGSDGQVPKQDYALGTDNTAEHSLDDDDHIDFYLCYCYQVRLRNFEANKNRPPLLFMRPFNTIRMHRYVHWCTTALKGCLLLSLSLSFSLAVSDAYTCLVPISSINSQSATE